MYFGTDRDAVANAGTTTTGIYRGRLDPNSYTPSEALEWGQSYYWRIDEYNTDMTISEGRVWGFTVADYLSVEDFESYDDFDNRIYLTWIDGYGSPSQGIPGNGTGSTVGNLRPPYAETVIVHEDLQAMPMDFNNIDLPYRSEAVRTFDTPQDWTRKDVKSLIIWYRGLPASYGSFSYDPVTDVYTLTARSGDIWGVSDQFRYVYKKLSGAGAIQAKVVAVTEGAAAWTKVGVMIREDLDPNSRHAFMMLTPPGRTALQHRAVKAQRSDISYSDEGKITFPFWVKIERTANTFTGSYSANGSAWIQQPNDENLDRDPEGMNPATITMNPTVYIGLALCSNNTAATVEAQFSNVTTTGTVTGVWQSRDIGITSNAPEGLYVVLEDSAAQSKAVKHPDPDAVLSSTYQEWNIDLAEFAPVNLTAVKKLYIGLGDRDLPTPGGTGSLYVDDVRLYRPRCIPSLAKPAGSFNDDCVVDYLDLDIMTNNWLAVTYNVTPDSSNLNVGLIGQYRLNGNLNDSVGGNHGSKMGVGAAVYTTDSMQGTDAIVLDGIDDYVDFGSPSSWPSGYSARSMSAWAKTDSVAAGWRWIAAYGTGSTSQAMFVGINGPNLYGGGYGDDVFEDDFWEVDVWHHICLTYDGTAARMYADGNLVASEAKSWDLALDRAHIGRQVNDAAEYWDGLVDDVRIYDRVLSQGEAASLAGKTAPFTQPLYLLLTPPEPNINLYDDDTIDLKDYALLADTFLDEELWP